jgi:hypothetical protein
LQTGVEGGVELEFFFEDGDEHISGDGAPDLRLDGILAVAEEALDAPVLLARKRYVCKIGCQWDTYPHWVFAQRSALGRVTGTRVT